jgi:hypothetical protein
MSTDEGPESSSATASETDDYVEDASEDESEYEDGVKGRISGFNKPKIGSKPSKRPRTSSSPKQVKGKGSRKGRNLGKLAQLVNMPLDVFFEITSQLQPLDILQLSRVSKHFRSTFASRRSRHVWVAARKNIPDMPDCPDDLTEPQYASLMFEHNCQACGKSRANKTDYSLRVRFCGPCFKANVKKGSTIIRPYGKVPEVVLTLVPRSLKSSNYYGDSSVFQAKRNSTSSYFYVSELEMVIKRWTELEHDQKALQLFEKRQLAVASDIMNNAIVLNDWVHSSKRAKYSEDFQRSTNRETSIKEKLAELGYEAEDFPQMWDGRWAALVSQPRELSDRIWKVIKPKLEALIKEEKESKLEIARKHRLGIRAIEFKPFWESLIPEISDAKEIDVIPTFSDARELPAVAELLADDDANTIVTEERFLAKKDAILADIPGYQTRIKRELIKVISVPVIITSTQDPIAQSSDEEPDFSILTHASTLFRCPGSWSCKVLLPYPDIFFHDHVAPQLGTFVSYSLSRLRPIPAVKPMAIQILKALDLAEDTPASALNDLNGRFVCLCGHPNFLKPMDFGSLVNHFITENEWYNTMKRQRKCDADITVVNDHDLTVSHPRIALIACRDSSPCDQKPGDGETTDSNDDFGAKFCSTCWQFSQSYFTLKSEAELAYHMKAKHLQEAVFPGDAVLATELTYY